MVGRTNALTATSATKVAAIIEVAEALANACDDDPDAFPPDLPPLPLDLPLVRMLPLVLPMAAAEEETDVPLPDNESEEESRSLFLSSSAGSSYVFSQ